MPRESLVMQTAVFKPRSGVLPEPHDKAPLRGLCFLSHLNPKLTLGAKKDAPARARKQNTARGSSGPPHSITALRLFMPPHVPEHLSLSNYHLSLRPHPSIRSIPKSPSLRICTLSSESLRLCGIFPEFAFDFAKTFGYTAK